MVDFQAYVPLFLIGLISAVLVRLLKSRGAKHHLPPTPFALPIVGHLHLLYPIPHQAFHKLSLRHGPIYRLLLGSRPCVVVNSPETAKEFLKTNENNYLDRPKNMVSEYILASTEDASFSHYGPYWIFMRRMMVTQLLNKATLDLLSSVRRDEITCFIKSLSENAKNGKVVDLSGKLRTLKTNVISRMVISKRCSENENEADDMRSIMAGVNKTVGTFNVSDYIWLFKGLDLQGLRKQMKDTRARFFAIIEKIIEDNDNARKHKETGKAKDLLNLLLDIARDENMDIKLSMDNIKGFLLALLVGGTDTSASAVEWGISELINNPNIMKKARQEIDQVVGKNRVLQESDIPNLPYLQKIVKETLRLHPTGAIFARHSLRDCKVAGYHIPANSDILFNGWAIGRDPNYWESPLEFRPERFKENQMDIGVQQFNMLPFGSGKRMCPGIPLASLMVQTTLGAMIQCFDFKMGKNGNLTTVDMEEESGLSIPRANPLVCIPVARLDPFPSFI